MKMATVSHPCVNNRRHTVCCMAVAQSKRAAAQRSAHMGHR